VKNPFHQRKGLAGLNTRWGTRRFPAEGESWGEVFRKKVLSKAQCANMGCQIIEGIAHGVLGDIFFLEKGAGQGKKGFKGKSGKNPSTALSHHPESRMLLGGPNNQRT